MTVNEAIEVLRALKAKGYGEVLLHGTGADGFYAVDGEVYSIEVVEDKIQVVVS